jgi:hypothetical protein
MENMMINETMKDYAKSMQARNCLVLVFAVMGILMAVIQLSNLGPYDFTPQIYLPVMIIFFMNITIMPLASFLMLGLDLEKPTYSKNDQLGNLKLSMNYYFISMTILIFLPVAKILNSTGYISYVLITSSTSNQLQDNLGLTIEVSNTLDFDIKKIYSLCVFNLRVSRF